MQRCILKLFSNHSQTSKIKDFAKVVTPPLFEKTIESCITDQSWKS